MRTILKIIDKVFDDKPNVIIQLPVTPIRYSSIISLLTMKFKVEEMNNETDSNGQHVASIVISKREDQDIKELIGVLFEGMAVIN
jgi:hypothetical protein